MEKKLQINSNTLISTILFNFLFHFESTDKNKFQTNSNS